MGQKRGRPKGRKKEQINIRLLPEYASLLHTSRTKPSPLFWWFRRNDLKVSNGALKHGKTEAANPSNAVTTLLHLTILACIKADPERFLDFAAEYNVHARWAIVAENTIERG